MSKKVRIKVKVAGYYFPSHDGLIWHSNKFWFNEIPVRVVYNNGSQAVLVHGTKIGLKKLRKEAQKCFIELIDPLPF